mmetsp:Transcript_62650/g.74182  ORF Transcript_62650/g.74182 Transcript_62650/m.74182 type:complete len:146 (+) Transcript_62650:244-681(+)
MPAHCIPALNYYSSHADHFLKTSVDDPCVAANVKVQMPADANDDDVAMNNNITPKPTATDDANMTDCIVPTTPNANESGTATANMLLTNDNDDNTEDDNRMQDNVMNTTTHHNMKLCGVLTISLSMTTYLLMSTQTMTLTFTTIM